MKNTKMNNTEAVSPVIGVIAGIVRGSATSIPHSGGGETYGRDIILVSYIRYLYYASTVILAAVIAAFVFGMAGGITKTKVVAFTAHRAGATNITVTNMGGQDVGTLTAVNVTVNSNAPYVWSTGTAVGARLPLGSTNGVVAGQNRVLIMGTFTDSGSAQVLLDTTV